MNFIILIFWNTSFILKVMNLLKKMLDHFGQFVISHFKHLMPSSSVKSRRWDYPDHYEYFVNFSVSVFFNYLCIYLSVKE